MLPCWERPLFILGYLLGARWHRLFKPAGEGERLANNGHENGHQLSNITHTTPIWVGTEKPVIVDELTSGEMWRD
jgi:hypothetical protein